MRTAQAPHPAEPAATAGMHDDQWVKDTIMGGMTEVELGQLAKDKASNDRVKELAGQMVTDHGKATDELKTIAASKNIAAPTALDAKHQATKDRLSKLSGPSFDRAYANEMVTGHTNGAASFRREAQSGKDPDVKAFAAKTLPTVENHLQMWKTAQKNLNLPTSTSGKTSSETPAANESPR